MNFWNIVVVFMFLFIFPGSSSPQKTKTQKNKKRSSESKFYPEKEDFLLQKRVHKLKEFSQQARRRLADLDDYSKFYKTYLSEILRVRVPGTVGHHAVKQFIIGKLKEYGWKVSVQEFQMPTPIGVRNFTNIVGTLYPDADRTLALAAHYDSKLIPPKNGKYFLAATDSAVPCAMLLDFAKVLSDKAKQKKNAPKNVSPQVIFLDGEEAFVEWTAEDSIYGSRKLAEVLNVTPHQNKNLASQGLTQLDAMDAFVLFDLLGMKDPVFYDFFPSTSHLYTALQKIEQKLHDAKQLTSTRPYFIGKPAREMYIEDDHIPFLRKNVPILHLIPVPFPSVWHTLNDDETALDQQTIENMLKIFRYFVLSYFHLV